MYRALGSFVSMLRESTDDKSHPSNVCAADGIYGQGMQSPHGSKFELLAGVAEHPDEGLDELGASQCINLSSALQSHAAHQRCCRIPAQRGPCVDMKQASFGCFAKVGSSQGLLPSSDQKQFKLRTEGEGMLSRESLIMEVISRAAFLKQDLTLDS